MPRAQSAKAPRPRKRFACLVVVEPQILKNAGLEKYRRLLRQPPEVAACGHGTLPRPYVGSGVPGFNHRLHVLGCGVHDGRHEAGDPATELNEAIMKRG